MTIAFKLVPFPSQQPPTGLSVSGQVEAVGEQIEVQFVVQGPIANLKFDPLAPEDQDSSLYREGLWESSCLEIFATYRHSHEAYGEWNFAPSGYWWHMDFSRYRARAALLSTQKKPHVIWEKTPATLVLKTIIPNPYSAPVATLGLSAILDFPSGKTFWALKHCAPEPDFHDRQSFTITL